jgi:glucose/mannose transport system substrate-binding protein
MTSYKFKLGLAVTLATLGATAAKAEDDSKKVEVMHLWTSGGEAAAMQVIKDSVQAHGLTWQDSAVAGAGGQNEAQALQARFAAGNPPVAATAQGQGVLEYAAQDSLGNLNEIAAKDGWEKLIAPELLPFTKVNGNWVSVPFNMHRENMLYINKKVLAQFGGQVPQTWDDFIALLAKIKAGGKIIPLALGGDDWQETEIFTDIMLGQGGVQFYKDAILKLDTSALGGPKMVATFDTLRKVLAYTDENRTGRDWAIATGMVARGEAAMQFQGNWATGDLMHAGLTPNKDFLCVTPPGNGHIFDFLTDFLVAFKQPNDTARANQATLAEIVMDKKIQEDFNKKKGSIPARLDASSDGFNACSQLDFNDREAALKDGTVIASFNENMALRADIRGAIVDVVHEFSNNPSMTSDEAVQKVLKNVKAL